MTLLRLALLVPIAYFAWLDLWVIAFWLFLIAGVSDLLDGALARHFKWETSFGQYMDPLADKVLCGGLIVALAWLSAIPALLALVVVVRELTIMGGYLAHQILFGPVPHRVTFLSKINTGILVALLLLVLGENASIVGLALIAEYVVDPWLILLQITLVTVTGIHYVYIGTINAMRASQGNRRLETCKTTSAQ